MNEDVKGLVAQLQGLEGSLQSIGMQRSQVQTQLLEVESALAEIEGAKSAYRIVGSIMVSAEPSALKAELIEKKERLGVRLKSVERQELSLKERAQSLQEKILKTSGGSS